MSLLSRPQLAAPQAWVRAYAIASRFYATGAVLLAMGVATSMQSGQHVAGIGQVLGASVLPQVFDLGLARRISMESAVIDGVANRDAEINALTGQYLWFAFSLSVLVACYDALIPALFMRYGWEILLAVVLAGLSAPISVVATTALYGWRRPSVGQMLVSIAVDLTLLALQLAMMVQWPQHLPLALAVALLLRQVLLCLVLGALAAPAAAMRQVRRSIASLAQTASRHGTAELRLGLFCVVAWGTDPFLYVHFAQDHLVPTHLTATRLAQAAISIMNVFLISSLWAGHAAGPTAMLQARARRALWSFSAGAVLVLGIVWPVMTSAWPATWSRVAVALAVLTATAIAMWRQQFAVEYLRHKMDLRSGATYQDLLLIMAIKACAVLSSQVILLEIGSIVASIFYLFRLHQHHREAHLDPA